MSGAVRILGLDPGLRRTGWGLVISEGNRLSHVASGVVLSSDKEALAIRLRQLYEGLSEQVRTLAPDEVAVEETFVNENAQSTLKLGHARARGGRRPALAGLPVAEYTALQMKKAMTGSTAPFIVMLTDISSKGMPSNSNFMSSTVSIATPAIPTSPATRGLSLS